MKCYSLREANYRRNVEWTGTTLSPGLLWRATELSGEIGELCEVLLASRGGPLERSEADIVLWLSSLAEECADGVICLDLLGMDLEFPQLSIVSAAFPSMSDDRLAGLLGAQAGCISNVLKKLEREARGWPGSRATKDDLFSPMVALMRTLAHVADRYGVDLADATVQKFNATSEKVGLTTRLVSFIPTAA